MAGEEVGVAVDGGAQDGLAVRADVQWVVVHQLEQVLVQQHHLAALLALLRLHVAVPQRALQVEHLCHLAPVEQVLHDKQVQLLLCVVLGVLVADAVHPQDLGQGSGPLKGTGGQGVALSGGYLEVYFANENVH